MQAALADKLAMNTRLRDLHRFVRSQRAVIREDLAPELSLDEPTFLVVEPYDHVAQRVSGIIRGGFPDRSEPRIFRAAKTATALGCPVADVWLVEVCVDHHWLDALPLCDRLRYRFPHAQIVGRSVHDTPHQPGALSLSVDWLLGSHEVETRLPSLVDACRLSRRYLLDRLVETELGQRIVARFGPDAAVLAGVPAPSRKTTSLEDAKLRELRVALTETRGNVSEAARRLGIDRSTVYRWRKKLSGLG